MMPSIFALGANVRAQKGCAYIFSFQDSGAICKWHKPLPPPPLFTPFLPPYPLPVTVSMGIDADTFKHLLRRFWIVGRDTVFCLFLSLDPTVQTLSSLSSSSSSTCQRCRKQKEFARHSNDEFKVNRNCVLHESVGNRQRNARTILVHSSRS